jgi:hypothetical protein
MIHNNKMLIYFFQGSLTRSVLSWYMRLDNTKINKWKDLTDAFLKQYKFNMKITLDKTSLMTMEKGNKMFVMQNNSEIRQYMSSLHW